MRYLITVILMLLMVGCTGKTFDNNTAAIVNKEKITIGMLEEKIDELPEYYRTAASQHKKEILNDLIIEKLLYEEAKKRGLAREQEVQKLVEKATKKILIAKLLDDETEIKGPVSDEDIEIHYKQYKDQYAVPERVRASHILVSTEEEADKVLAQLKAGADFAELAKKQSKDLTKDRGGDLGYFQKGQMIPEFEQICFELEPGQTSGVVKTRFGYHVIKVTDKKPAQQRELSEVKEKIRANLIEEEKQKRFMNFVESLKSKADIKINNDMFNKVSVEETVE